VVVNRVLFRFAEVLRLLTIGARPPGFKRLKYAYVDLNRFGDRLDEVRRQAVRAQEALLHFRYDLLLRLGELRIVGWHFVILPQPPAQRYPGQRNCGDEGEGEIFLRTSRHAATG
jgi:hypothetical protein